MTSRVSAIVPVYNRAHCLRAAVDSLRATGYSDLEILIVDDGSTDQTLNVAKALEAEAPSTIRVLRHPDGLNHGPGASRNLGVHESSGAYLCFLDSDDLVLPHRFEVAVPLIEDDATIDGVSEPFNIQDGNEPPRASVEKRSALISRLLGPGLRWNTNSILLRKACFLDVGGFSERLRTCEDVVLWLKLALSARIVSGSSQAVSVYRRHEGNTALILENSLRAYLEVQQWSRSRALDEAGIRVLREALWGKMLFVCDRLRAQGRAGPAIRALFEAGKSDPAVVARVQFWKNLAFSASSFVSR
jgi:glycosyltransferase involved in cell wall biosynthesis